MTEEIGYFADAAGNLVKTSNPAAMREIIAGANESGIWELSHDEWVVMNAPADEDTDPAPAPPQA